MSTYAITDRATQLSQAQASGIFVQNVGTDTIYLSNDSNVSATNYGLQLSGGSGVQWPDKTNLWAVTDTNGSSIISLIEGANGLALGNVVANITGPVEAIISGPVDATILGPVTVNPGSIFPISGTVGIGAPVNVQGGGTRLASGSVNVGTSSVSVSVPAPANGLTYYGLRFEFHITTAQAATEASIDISIYAGIGISGVTYCSLVNPSNGSATVGFVGDPRGIAVNMPMAGTYPLQVTFIKQSGGTQNIQYAVYGLSAALPYVTTDDNYVMNAGSGLIAIGGAASTQYIYTPPSFSPLYIDCYAGSGVPANATPLTDYHEMSGGTWTLARAQPFRFPGTGTGAGGWNPSTGYTFQIPGTGLPGRLTSPTSWTAGIAYVNLRKNG